MTFGETQNIQSIASISFLPSTGSQAYIFNISHLKTNYKDKNFFDPKSYVFLHLLSTFTIHLNNKTLQQSFLYSATCLSLNLFLTHSLGFCSHHSLETHPGKVINYFPFAKSSDHLTDLIFHELSALFDIKFHFLLLNALCLTSRPSRFSGIHSTSSTPSQASVLVSPLLPDHYFRVLWGSCLRSLSSLYHQIIPSSFMSVNIMSILCPQAQHLL